MSLHPDCLAELSLQHAPFDSLPSEDFIYTDSLIEDMVAAANRAIDSSGAIVLLTGEFGSGRSMQLMRLLGSLPENFELIAFRARMNTRFEAVDYTIRSHLRAGGHDDPDRALSDLMSERIRAGYDPVIAVDDAHLLGMDIINILLRMRGEILGVEGRAPRLVLVGDQVLLRRRLQLRPSDEHHIARFTMRPFSFEQTEAYLTHRLRAAGMNDPGEILTEEVVADLQATSKGLPGALNEQANHWLERLCRSRRGEGEEPDADEAPSREDRTPVYMRGMPALGVTGDPPDEPPEDLTPIPRREPLPPSEDAEHLRAADAGRFPGRRRQERESGDTRVPFWSRSWFVPAVAALVAFLIVAPFARHLFDRPEAPPTTTVQLPLPVEPEPAPERDPVVPEDQDLVELPFDDRVPAEIPGSTTPPPATPTIPATPEPAAEPPTPSPVSEPAVPEPEPAPAEPEPRAEPPPVDEPAPAAEPAPTVAPPPIAETTPPPAADANLAEDRDWLARQNRESLTIQLIAAADLGGARRYVEQHQLSGIRYVQTRSGGRDYVVALAGSFANREAAEQALGNLPAAVRADQPWIRSLGSVQDIQR